MATRTRTAIKTGAEDLSKVQRKDPANTAKLAVIEVRDIGFDNWGKLCKLDPSVTNAVLTTSLREYREEGLCDADLQFTRRRNLNGSVGCFIPVEKEYGPKGEIEGTVYTAPTTVVSTGAILKGRARILDGAVIGPYVIVEGNVEISGCKIINMDSNVPLVFRGNLKISGKGQISND